MGRGRDAGGTRRHSATGRFASTPRGALAVADRTRPALNRRRRQLQCYCAPGTRSSYLSSVLPGGRVIRPPPFCTSVSLCRRRIAAAVVRPSRHTPAHRTSHARVFPPPPVFCVVHPLSEYLVVIATPLPPSSGPAVVRRVFYISLIVHGH